MSQKRFFPIKIKIDDAIEFGEVYIENVPFHIRLLKALLTAII